MLALPLPDLQAAQISRSLLTHPLSVKFFRASLINEHEEAAVAIAGDEHAVILKLHIICLFRSSDPHLIEVPHIDALRGIKAFAGIALQSDDMNMELVLGP